MVIKGFRRLATLIGLTLVGAAVMKELRKPPADRRWHGKVASVPYDFRPPTWERVKATYWNPDDPQVVKDKVYGVGWDVNFAALARKAGLVS